MKEYLLGIDNGGTMAKTAVFAADGRELAVASQKAAMLDGPSGWSEIDAESLWQATAATVRQAVEQASVDPRQIVAVACTGHGNGLYLVDEHACPVRPAIGSSDNRAQSYIDRWRAEGIDEKIRRKTMQSIWPAQPNALLRWLIDNEPDSIAGSRWILMCKDFIRAKLTGRCLAERTDFSGTSLLNVSTGEYDDEVLEAWGLMECKRLMPPLVRSAETCGKVTAAAAEATGLVEGTPVAGGMFDIDACGLASAMTNPESLCIVSGTWGNNQYIARQPVVSPDIFMTSRYCIDGYYLMLEGSATSAGNLEWFVTQLLAQATDGEAADNRYQRCNELVCKTNAAKGGAMFLPFLYGCNVSPHGKAALVGLNGWQNAGHVLRAVYEGVVFSHQWHIRRLLQFRDPPTAVHLTGGAARSEVWSQIFADVLQWPVEVPAGTELGTLGAAICAAVTVGMYDSFASACQAMVRIARRHEPNRELAEVYAHNYQDYLELSQVLTKRWSIR